MVVIGRDCRFHHCFPPIVACLWFLPLPSPGPGGGGDGRSARGLGCGRGDFASKIFISLLNTSRGAGKPRHA